MIILHIVGPTFAGKSTYIQKHLAKEIVFDVRTFYSRNPGARGLAQTNYKQFMQMIHFDLKEHLKAVLKKYEQIGRKSFLVVESSGYNKAINSFVTRYNSFTILIETPIYVITARINQYLQDVGEGEKPRLAFDPFKSLLNFYHAFSFGNVIYDTKYFTQLDQYYPAFDPKKARQFLQDTEFERALW